MLHIASAWGKRAARRDRGNTVAVDGELAREGPASGAIEDQGIAEYMIMLCVLHGGTLAKSVFL